METGRKYTLKLNKKGEYFSLGITPGKYKVTLFDPEGKQIFYMTGITVGLDELDQDIDLKKEAAAQAAGLGASSIPSLLVEGDNKPGLAYAVAKAIADAGINLGFLVAQVVGRRYSAVVGFENEADANNAAALIKKATAARKK